VAACTFTDCAEDCVNTSITMGVAAVDVIAIVGTAVSIGMFASPAKHFRGIWREKKVGEWSVNPYAVGFAQCLGWLIYDIVTPDRVGHAIVNAIGGLLQLIFCFIFLFCAQGQRLQVVGKLICGFTAPVAWAFLVIGTADNLEFVATSESESKVTTILGFACMVVNVIMYSAPLEVAVKVMRRFAKVEDCLPWLLSLSILVNSGCWGAYGLILQDKYIWLPSAWGIIVAVAQLLLFVCYAKRGVSKESKNNDAIMPEDTLEHGGGAPDEALAKLSEQAGKTKPELEQRPPTAGNGDAMTNDCISV